MILRRWLASARTRLRGGTAEREFDDELGAHLEMAVEENLARGMNEREARRVAHVDLGGVATVKEARRQADSLYWLDTLLQDLRAALRQWTGRPLFALLVTATLGLSLGLATVAFSLFDAILLRPLPLRRQRSPDSRLYVFAEPRRSRCTAPPSRTSRTGNSRCRVSLRSRRGFHSRHTSPDAARRGW